MNKVNVIFVLEGDTKIHLQGADGGKKLTDDIHKALSNAKRKNIFALFENDNGKTLIINPDKVLTVMFE